MQKNSSEMNYEIKMLLMKLSTDSWNFFLHEKVEIHFLWSADIIV